MLFNSHEFIFYYLPVVFLGFFWIAHSSRHLAALWLTAASLFFYGWWNPKFVILILASIGFNYAAGYLISQARLHGDSMRWAKLLLSSALATNIGLLGYYKYTNFFINTTNQLAGVGWGQAEILLPLGISFFTFTQIAFLVDTYRGIAREYNFVHYVLFVTYFPHLIAGPVLHHKQMMPQFQNPQTYKLAPTNLTLGITLFCLGLAKKVLLADTLSQYVGPAFQAAAQGNQPAFTEAWQAALGYTLQLYFDFSGYSDMAVGLSLMFGIRLPVNFNSPYQSRNIVDFWRRWHITLSQFLRDYLYIPLGGNRYGKARRYINLLVTMILGGLWHGANWTFVAWGALHGLFLAINHTWHFARAKVGLPIEDRSSAFGRIVGVAITFLCVIVAWVFFRADNMAAAWILLKAMVNWSSAAYPTKASAIVLGCGLSMVLFAPNTNKLLVHIERQLHKWPSIVYMAFSAALAALCILNINGESEFLYFQF